MQDFTTNYSMPYMQPSGTYDPYNQMMAMPEQQLERMYPQIYYIVNPIVIRQCDMIDYTYGPSYIPTQDEMERMTDNILSDVEGRLNAGMSGGYNGSHGNPDGDPRGSHFLRALIGTLLIRELLGRRRRRRFRSPFFFPVF